MGFFPKSPKFFDNFEVLAEILYKAASLLPRIKYGKGIQKYASEVRKLELKASALRHALAIDADQTFITPIDREDIHLLAQELDDIVDRIEDLVSMYVIFQLKADLYGFNKVGTKVKQIAEKLLLLIQLLKHRNKHISEMKEIIKEIHALENEGDDLYKMSITALFKGEKDTKILLKWKQIFDDVEGILDQSEDAADTVNQIIIKNF